MIYTQLAAPRHHGGSGFRRSHAWTIHFCIQQCVTDQGLLSRKPVLVGNGRIQRQASEGHRFARAPTAFRPTCHSRPAHGCVATHAMRTVAPSTWRPPAASFCVWLWPMYAPGGPPLRRAGSSASKGPAHRPGAICAQASVAGRRPWGQPAYWIAILCAVELVFLGSSSCSTPST